MLDFNSISDPEGISLYETNDYFRPFPKPEDVFASDVERHFDHLLPIASIDVKLRHYDWQGTIHLVSPIEPEEGQVGDGTEQFHNSYCSENWVGYKIIDGKLELAADFCFFQKNNLEDHYKEIKNGYIKNIEFFKDHGCIYSKYSKPDKNNNYNQSDKGELVSHLGGASFYGNWSANEGTTIKILEEEVNDELYAYPLTKDGRKYEFIGMITPYICLSQSGHSHDHDADIHVFFDPVEQIVLTTFDW